MLHLTQLYQMVDEEGVELCGILRRNMLGPGTVISLLSTHMVVTDPA